MGEGRNKIKKQPVKLDYGLPTYAENA